MKLHLRVVPVRDAAFRVVTLRPSMDVRFSNNYFHDTWHILGDPAGASVLARLLWGLAFQRRPGTVVVLDRPHVVRTPFEADRAAPCLFAQSGLTGLDPDRLAGLRRALRRPGGPTATVRWQTFGMEAARDEDRPIWRWREREVAWSREHMGLRGGFLCYSAPPEVLREQALSIEATASGLYRGSGYCYLAQGRRGWHHPDGEVQVLADFRARVSAARVARDRELARPDRPHATDDERRAIWTGVDRLLAARAPRRTPGGGRRV